ncbi:hypothetical protein R3P38DRAFT_2775609 [Favolaschia claudopus]|uniref:Fork-head domain-containing protein n=1 Tax=Favolaschia claudopus TaxID=2862362 RepID=A0AAW0BVE1_9AGAR
MVVSDIKSRPQPISVKTTDDRASSSLGATASAVNYTSAPPSSATSTTILRLDDVMVDFGEELVYSPSPASSPASAMSPPHSPSASSLNSGLDDQLGTPTDLGSPIALPKVKDFPDYPSCYPSITVPHADDVAADSYGLHESEYVAKHRDALDMYLESEEYYEAIEEEVARFKEEDLRYSGIAALPTLPPLRPPQSPVPDSTTLPLPFPQQLRKTRARAAKQPTPPHQPLPIKSCPTPDDFVDPTEHIRAATGIPLSMPVNLWSLPNPAPGDRPGLSLSHLVLLAIHGSPARKLTKRQICEALGSRFPLSLATTKTEGSVRHLLSLGSWFIKSPRPLGERGQGGYWIINIEARSKWGKYKRERKRHATVSRAGPSHTHDKDDEQDELSDSSSSSVALPPPKRRKTLGASAPPKPMAPPRPRKSTRAMWSAASTSASLYDGSINGFRVARLVAPREPPLAMPVIKADLFLSHFVFSLSCFEFALFCMLYPEVRFVARGNELQPSLLFRDAVSHADISLTSLISDSVAIVVYRNQVCSVEIAGEGWNRGDFSHPRDARLP